MPYSERVLTHFSQRIITSDYLIHTMFSMKDLNDIAESRPSEYKTPPYRPSRYLAKPKMRSSGNYKEHLKKAGKEISKNQYMY
jgi:hypothetical protein